MTTTLGSCTEAVCNPTISTATNRLTTSGYSYDKNGNLTSDAEGKQFAYDAENHQTEVKNNQSTTIGEYVYDGDGRRVKKVSSTEMTVFVYDAGGQLVAEYSTQTAQTPKVSYLTTDHLGSPRVITNENGAVIDRKDYTAFGEESFSAERTSGLGYAAADEVRKVYTGYEKDNESGLDFAQARYYSSTHGRYTSVDPLTASASIRNPQTFNRYSYVLNSPYKFVDPLGLISAQVTPSGNCDPPNSSCVNGSSNKPSPDTTDTPEQQHTDEGIAGSSQTSTKPASSQTPANIQIVVGDLKTYNGESMILPDGTKTEEKYYGRARINEITVLDQTGNPIKEEDGVTIREDITLKEAKPEGAEKIINISTPEDLSVGRSPIYDTVGPVSTDPETLNLLDKVLPPISVVYEQMITVKDRSGTPTLKMVNTITVTNKTVDYKVGSVENIVISK